MIANYHTHTHRCNHAIGREEDYVQEALNAGFEILGWADHTPYIFSGGYYSHFRMRPVQLPGYVQTIQELQRKYAGQIEMPIGLETEYYPKHFGNLIEFLRDHPIDYLILGQHFIGNEYDAPYSGLVTDDKDVVRQYCRQSMEAMNTGLFTYFAHPDILGFLGDPKVYKEQMRRLCRAAKQCDIPLEINLQGQRRGRHYPNPVFWEIAAEEGCKIVIGCDAHKIEDIASPEEMKQAEAFAQRFSIELLSTIPLHPIK